MRLFKNSPAWLVALAIIGAVAFATIETATAQQPPGTRSTPCDPLTPNNAVCLQITAPTTMVDGTPTVLPLTYRIEQQFNGGAWTTIAASTTVLNFYVKGLAPGPYVFRVYAKCGTCSAESDPSPTAGRSATAPVIITGPPAIQVVQVIIDEKVAPVFTVLSDGSRSNTLAGLADVGTACDGPVLFKYKMKYWRRPVSYKPWMSGAVPSSTAVAAPCSS